MKFFLIALAVIVTWLSPSSALAAAAPAAPAKLTLKYFDIRGAAETCRVLFALAGQDYDDHRYEIDPTNFDSPTFLAAKESGELRMNLNRAPVLVTPDGVAIGQSKAIERYLSRKFGLMGQSPEDEAVIECIAEHCRDVKDAAMRKGFSAFTRNKTDEEKAEARKEWFDTDMPELLGKIEAVVKGTGTDGYAFGTSTSYADVAIWALLRDCQAADRADTAKASEECKALNAIADTIASNEGVSKWLSERPESMF